MQPLLRDFSVSDRHSPLHQTTKQTVRIDAELFFQGDGAGQEGKGGGILS